MSTFVLKREYALQLPNSYAEIDREEMEYVDGGVYLSNDDLKAVLVTAGVTGVSVAAVVAASYTLAAAIAATVPVGGWLTGGLIATYAGAFAVVAVQAIHEGKGMHIRLAFPWGLSFEVG
ncbi:hypothetical protein [Clostridium sp.]|uniref:hypothetical protein n=1 Tax=Clostridium sp. TaxID=1506 RepID=UPI0029129AFA|nr:hypothetical protein [Clostridium sp.]MDU5108112.1 hypothetical protein [Clostridium sp.]